MVRNEGRTVSLMVTVSRQTGLRIEGQTAVGLKSSFAIFARASHLQLCLPPTPTPLRSTRRTYVLDGWHPKATSRSMQRK